MVIDPEGVEQDGCVTVVAGAGGITGAVIIVTSVTEEVHPVAIFCAVSV